MKQLVAILVILVSLTAYSHGNNVPGSSSSVSGIIKDSTSGEALSGVKVQIQGTELITYSDRDGNFTFTQIPTGDIKVIFQLVSFQTAEMTIPDVRKPVSQIEISLVER